MAKSLMIGNGINRLGNEVSWEGLLRHLSDGLPSARKPKYMSSKPFTLLYEEILLSQASARTDRKDLGEFALKKRVADAMGSLKVGDFHRRVMSADVRHVITTNYDYNLERAVAQLGRRSNLQSESKYSLFRRREVSGKRASRFYPTIHRHLEQDMPEVSIFGA